VAFSVFGVVSSLTEEPEQGVSLEAAGLTACSGQREEAVTDSTGTFRIRGLLPHCLYNLRLKPDSKSSIYRVSPAETTISVSEPFL